MDADGKPLDLKNTAALREWVKGKYQGRTVRIEDDGKLVLFAADGIGDSLKRRNKKKSDSQRQVYAGLDNAIENSIYDSFEEGDANHPHVKGQDVYYSAVQIGEGYFGVRIKLDKVNAEDKLHYKDHKVTEIEIAPALYAAQSEQNGGHPPAANAISGISLSVLKGDVKPSRIENGTLYQFAGEQSAMAEPVRANLARAMEFAASGTENEDIRQRTGWFKGMDGKWRYEIPDNMEGIHWERLTRSGRGALVHIYDNPALYAAYPDLRTMEVQLYTPVNPGEEGFYNPGRKSIGISKEVSDGMKRRHLLHEIQHAIQDIEGFARGSSPEYWSRRERKATADSNFQDISLSARPIELYERTAGEIEARDTVNREGLSGTERMERSPNLRSDAIVLFGDAPVASMSIDPVAERAARAKAIQEMPAKKITPDETVSGKEDAENLFASWKDIQSPDGFLTTFPKNTVGKIKYNKGFNVMEIMGSLRDFFEKSIYIGERQNKGEYADRAGKTHKAKSSIAGFKDYINKFADADGTEYYIRFTSQVENQSRKNPNKVPRHELHSTAISEIAIYKAADVPTQAGHRSPVEGKATAFVDHVLQDFFNSVKPDVTLNHGKNRRHRGHVTIRDIGYTITLSKEANLSTLIHELGYVFEEELRRIVASGMGDEGQRADLAILDKWLSRFDDDAELKKEYTERQIADVIQPLTERDWKFIAAVWKTFEQYKMEAFAMHERVTGTRPTEVEAMPFTVRTADGKLITVPGGYFPILYDKAQADPKLAGKLDEMPEAFAAATRKGHLKERTKTGAGSPLRLDMTGIARALDDVITDIYFREALIDVGRILRDKSSATRWKAHLGGNTTTL